MVAMVMIGHGGEGHEGRRGGRGWTWGRER
jgi:hypothetical protein